MESFEDVRVKVLGFMEKGQRRAMEDTCSMESIVGSGASLIGVYDGHGGNSAAIYVKEKIGSLLASNRDFHRGNYAESLHQVFMELERLLIRRGTSGTTATVALITATKVFVASVGDSFAMLLQQDGTWIKLTEDHKHSYPGEMDRVRRAGGSLTANKSIVQQGVHIWQLAMTRSLGDRCFKSNKKFGAEEQAVSPVPDIVEFEIPQGCGFLVLASDGVDMFRAQWKMEKLLLEDELMSKNKKYLQRAAKECGMLSEFNKDNQTLVVIQFKAAACSPVDKLTMNKYSWYTNFGKLAIK
ncbi:probable protein phosphatase 2C 6 [Selaginella moellendorffii]|nr:probable protein phosphatase 2C 6 [Selaginella moellendorffii]|eukprot:XP_002962310.2 probable protein phosphatase 2C 6 [Selaginella moellendorffii]